jgi:lambda family phage tail tape measure protein
MTIKLPVQAVLDDQVSPGLKRIQDQTQKTQKSFDGLKTAMAGIAFLAIARAAGQYAATINDAASATNIAQQSILGLGQALTTNGGQATKATDAVQKFSLSMGQALTGSTGAQKAFESLGISLKDLGTLDENELLARTVESLGAIPDAGRRSALQMQIFGKTLSGVNAAGLAQDFRRLTAEQERNAQAVRANGQAMDNLNALTNRFQMAVMRSITPVVEAFNRLPQEKLEQMVEGVVKLAAAVAALAASIKVFQLLGTVLAAVASAGAAWAYWTFMIKGGQASLASTARATAVTMVGLSRGFDAATTWAGRFKAIMIAIEVILAKRLPYLIKGLASLIGVRLSLAMSGMVGAAGLAAAALWALNSAVDAVTGKNLAGWFASVSDAIRLNFNVDVENAESRLARFLRSLQKAGLVRLSGPGSEGAASGTDSWDAITRRRNDEAAASSRQRAEYTEAAARAAENEKRAIETATAAYRAQGLEFARRFEQQTRLIGATEEQRMAVEALSEFETNYLNAVGPLLQKITQLRSDGNAAEQAAIPEIESGIQSITAAYQRQLPELQRQISARVQQMQIQRDILALEQASQDAAERRLSVESAVRDITLDAQKRIRDAYENIELSGLEGLDRKLREIEIQERNIREAALERVAAQFGDADPDGFVQAQRQIEQASRRAVEQRKAAVRALHQEQKSFSDGWRKAWSDYSNAARDAAAQGERFFKTSVQGLEDALVGFAKTGKFEWRSLVSDMAETLLRSGIQRSIASIGQSIGLGSLFGGGGSSAARGNTQNNPLYVLDVSTARAGATGALGAGVDPLGQLLSTLGGRGGGAGSFRVGDLIPGGGYGGAIGQGVPGSSSGGILGGVVNTVGRIASGIGSAIGGVVSGIKNIFGGFFATGGMIPPGKFGIVGERGPEIASGPATITPMGALGGTTQVTYNIQAVDAASFQALVARDPGFIHAVAMQGARSQPLKRK